MIVKFSEREYSSSIYTYLQSQGDLSLNKIYIFSVKEK
jgi:hypothetical protein